MGETKKFEIEFTELCDEYEVEVADFNEFYNKVVALAIQVQAPVILQGELLPCPFCGNEAELIEKGNNFTKKRFVTIKCTNKNCRAEMTNGAIRNDMSWLKEISANAWNKRAGREPQSK